MLSSVQADVWAALLEPHRRALLALLRGRPHTVGELVAGLGLAQPTTSKHLRVLREAGGRPPPPGEAPCASGGGPAGPGGRRTPPAGSTRSTPRRWHSSTSGWS